MEKETTYQSRSAREAQEIGYGSKSYWDYLERAAIEHREYFKKRGMTELAERMMTQSLGEALQGNDGD